tara:strand:+ start:925 stop:2148 length:1224 start_codon:yes stop_codon:yes gene_type:complete
MSKYNYRALNKDGRPVRGTLTAANERDLFQQLQSSGFELIDCTEIGAKSNRLGFLKAIKPSGIKTRDKIQIFVHLEQLQRAGVPMLDSLADVRDTAESNATRDILTELHREVSEGANLSEAMGKHPNVFENIFVSLIAAGEETGNLMGSFSQVVRHLKWVDAMNAKKKKALRYPKILMFVVVIVVGVMMTQVVPEVTGFLANIGQELPPVTRALIATSEFFTDYFLYLIVAGILIWMTFKIGRSVSDPFKYKTDYLALRIPVLGPLTQKMSLSLFCQTFAILFTSGLEVLKCLDAAGRTANNMVLRQALMNVKESVREGNPISKSMEMTGEFPTLVLRMVRIGEESGNLSGVLDQVAEFYDKDVNESIDGMIAMIEPALTVVLGGLMLWIAAGVFGPIYNSFGDMGI